MDNLQAAARQGKIEFCHRQIELRSLEITGQVACCGPLPSPPTRLNFHPHKNFKIR